MILATSASVKRIDFPAMIHAPSARARSRTKRSEHPRSAASCSGVVRVMLPVSSFYLGVTGEGLLLKDMENERTAV